MKRTEQELDRILDDALGRIRDERPEDASASRDRVWQKIAQEVADTATEAQIQSCADFQKLIQPLIDGELSGARKLLVEDHLGECLTCRRSLKELRSKTARRSTVREADVRQQPGLVSRWGWRVAAAAVLFVTFVGVSFNTDILSFETGGVVRVESVDGELFRLTSAGAVPVAAGDVLNLTSDEGIRTAKGSSAVLRLADDSAVEMRERSELAVRQRRHIVPGRRTDGVIGLARGSIIVDASDQGSGHLYVDTRDCQVAVKGTVFAVNHGIKGSRVSVIEGEVHVDYSGNNDVLLPGQQTTTTRSLQKVPVADEVAWSRNREQYVALLREVQVLSREIDEVLQPELRYTTDLLDLAPADTVIFLAMPNVSNGLDEAYDIIRDRMSSNPILKEWWEDTFASAEDLDRLGEVFDYIRAFGDQLGSEIVLTVPTGDEGLDEPLFLANVVGRESIVAMLEDQIARIEAKSDDVRLHIIDGPLPAASDALDPQGRSAHMYFWVRDDLLAVSPDFERLQIFDAVVGQALGSLRGSAFHARLAERYRNGVEWLGGVDLQTLLLLDDRPDQTLEDLGFLDVQHVIGERRQQDDKTENRAELTFDQPRRRMAAWLAEPAPLGSLEYISPDANLAVAFAMKDLGTLVDELFSIVGRNDAEFETRLAEFEQEQGIDIRRDIAAPLGGEFAMAFDGPVLPTPSWKLVMEVYDPNRLQQTIEFLIDRINAEAEGTALGELKIGSETAGGRDYHTIESTGTGLAVHYVFDDGFIVVGPSRALLTAALQSRALGVTITDSPDFRELLPRDAQVNFSGAFYHNLAPVLGPLSGAFGGAAASAGVTDETRAMIEALSTESKPSLTLVYGENERISVSSVSEGGLLSSGLSSLSGFGGLMGVQQSLLEALEQHAHGQAD